MIEYPHLPWAQAIIGVAFAAFGATPLYQTASIPDISGLPTPTAVYSLDETPPNLSAGSVTSIGTTTATLNVTTDEGNGWLYWVVSTNATVPSQWSMGNGNDGVGAAGVAAGRQAVSATGAQSKAITGLTASTAYKAFLVQQDAAGNRGAVLGPIAFSTISGAAWDPANSVTNWVFTNSNQTATLNDPSPGSNWQIARGLTGYAGDCTVTHTITAVGSGGFVPCQVGLTTGLEGHNLGADSSGAGESIGYNSTGAIVWAGTGQATVATYTTSDVIVFSRVGHVITVQKNGSTVYTHDFTNEAVFGGVTPAFAKNTIYAGVSSSNGNNCSVTLS